MHVAPIAYGRVRFKHGVRITGTPTMGSKAGFLFGTTCAGGWGSIRRIGVSVECDRTIRGVNESSYGHCGYLTARTDNAKRDHRTMYNVGLCIF